MYDRQSCLSHASRDDALRDDRGAGKIAYPTFGIPDAHSEGTGDQQFLPVGAAYLTGVTRNTGNVCAEDRLIRSSHPAKSDDANENAWGRLRAG